MGYDYDIGAKVTTIENNIRESTMTEKKLACLHVDMVYMATL